MTIPQPHALVHLLLLHNLFLIDMEDTARPAGSVWLACEDTPWATTLGVLCGVIPAYLIGIVILKCLSQF